MTMTGTPTTRQHPKFGNDRPVQCGDTVTQNDRCGVVEVIDTRHQCSIGIRWTDSTFSMEHPKGIAYSPQPVKLTFGVTVPVDLLDRLAVVLALYHADDKGPNDDAFLTQALFDIGIIVQAAALKAAER
jgi:hypothetical protein